MRQATGDGACRKSLQYQKPAPLGTQSTEGTAQRTEDVGLHALPAIGAEGSLSKAVVGEGDV